MSILPAEPGTAQPSKFTGITHIARLGLVVLVPLWIFSGGFVFIEPSAYELLFVPVLVLLFLAGVPLPRRLLPYLGIIIVFMPPAMAAVFMAKFNSFGANLTYTVITIYLMLTGFAVALYVAENPFARVRRITMAYIAAALVVGLIGLGAYFGVLPRPDLFMEYGRARGTFKDPNVYGPFFMLPLAFVSQRILMGRGKGLIVNLVIFLVLFLAMFVSFSRGAWGHFVVTVAMVFALSYFLEAGKRARQRLLALAVAGVVAGVALMAGLLSVPKVRDLFDVRASVVQQYDAGARGRFGRQSYAAEIVLNNPLGIGPVQFRNLKIKEEPHNTYLKVMMDYGWLGGAAFIALILMTYSRAIRSLAIPSPNRKLLIPLFATFVPLTIEAAIIDVDHWRHFPLIMGLIWGVTASYHKTRKADAGALP
jgi:O-antigen ligase